MRADIHRNDLMKKFEENWCILIHGYNRKRNDAQEDSVYKKQLVF